MRLAQFGTGASAYVFPPQADYSDNFGDLVQRTQRLPGLSGGYRHNGFNASPKEIGSVKVSFWLLAETPEAMQAKLDALYKMQHFGVKRLYMREWGALAAYRFTDAEVSSINTPHNVRNRPDLSQRVDVTFQCPDPYWYEVGTESWIWGDGVLWDEGVVWGGGNAPVNLPNLSNDIIEVVAGNAATYPRLTLVAPGTVTNTKIQRLKGSVVVDEVSWAGMIGPGSTLEINCRSSRVKIDGADAFTSAFDYLRPNFFRLDPGSNTVRVSFTAKTITPTLQIRYYTRW